MSRSRTALTVVVAAALGLVVAAFIAQWVVVDVQASGRSAVRVPVPLALLRAAAALVPGSVYRGARIPPELAARRSLILKAVTALRDSPDATLLTVRSREAKVSIVTRDGLLLVNAGSRSDGTNVRCRIPLNALHEALDRWDWKTVDPGTLLAMLGEAPRGPLVEVNAPETTVTISVW
ncbi:MAG: hypothetical protein GXP47_14450 [Acidobacteria bacterium]|nr:hypothetical protein [Acidobacteriota bacterium]